MDFAEERLTASQAARYLGIGYGCLAIWRCKQRKALPFVKIGRRVFYRKTDLDRFVVANTHPGDGPHVATVRRR